MHHWRASSPTPVRKRPPLKKTVTAAVLAGGLFLTGLTGCSGDKPTEAAPSQSAFVPVTATKEAVFPDKVSVPGGLELILTNSWDIKGCPDAGDGLAAMLKGCENRTEAVYTDEGKTIVVAFAVLNYAPGTGDLDGEVNAAKQSGAIQDYPALKGSSHRYSFNVKGAFGHVIVVNVGAGDKGKLEDVKRWVEPALKWLTDSLANLK